MATPLSKQTAAGALVGDEPVLISQLSASVTITAATLSALASDNSFNDSGSGFVAAGFAVDDYVHATGFTGNAANNIYSAKITVLTTGKMTIGGTDGNVIVDDAAGESVTITKWETHRTTAQDIADLGGGSGGMLDATWFNVKDPAYGALGDGSTDDTVAIQDAIDACEAAGGGTVYFPRGIYVVNGALQDTSRSNAQILLPLRDAVDTEAITVVLRGEAPPSADISVIGATPLPDNLSVIKGTLNTASGTAPCLIGGHGPVGTANNFTNIYLIVRDIIVQMPADPALTACDFSCVAQLDADNLVVHAGSFDAAAISAQATATSYGFRTPGNNNGALTRLGVVNVVGFYNGFQIGEHTNGQSLAAWSCMRAAEYVQGNHASYISRLAVTHCKKALIFTGGTHYFSIDQLNIEHASSGTWTPTNDIDDASNYGLGFLRWHVVLAGTGPDATFTINGGKYIQSRKVDQYGTLVLTDGASIATPANQGDLFKVTLGGNRTLADPTGMIDAQQLEWRIHQDGTGDRTLAFGAKFSFLGPNTIAPAVNAISTIIGRYDSVTDKIYCTLSPSQTSGAWTPVVQFGGASVGVTYAANGQVGRYVRTGNLIMATCYILLTNNGSSTGAFTIAGLPYISKNTTGQFHAAAVYALATPAGKNLQFFTDPNTSVLRCFDVTNGTIATEADVQDTAEFMITLMYECA